MASTNKATLSDSSSHILLELLAAYGVDRNRLKCIHLESKGLVRSGELLVAAAEIDRLIACVTLVRELETGLIDRLGRFDESALTWDVTRPWVDHRVVELVSKLGGDVTGIGSKFQVVIAHDVDRTTTWEPTCLVSAALHSGGLRKSAGIPLRDALSSRAIIRTIGQLLEFERDHSVWAHYFMMAGPYGLSRYSTRTDAHWSSARTVGRLVRQAGMSLGLHGSFAARDRNSYGAEKVRLEQALDCSITTHRNHYLRFDPARLYAQLDGTGIEYDLSVGFVSRIGFRNGRACCHNAFDLSNKRFSRIFSVPQLYMDTVMQHRSPQQILGELREALTRVRQVQGCVCLVFHPETFLIDGRAWPLFKEIILLCKEMGANLSGILPQCPAASRVGDQSPVEQL